MASGEKDRVQGLETDLVVMGGGGAGLGAALAAAEKGIKVILLEKRGATGGNTAMAVGLFGIESPVQQRAATGATRDEIFRRAMAYAHWKVNPRIVRAFIDKSGDTIGWLEKMGLVFECIALYYGQDPLVWHRPEGLCARMTKVMTEECRRRGVEIFTRTPVKKLLTGPGSEVTGVVAESKEEKLDIKAKSVVIASGGYGGNKELLEKYCWYYNDKLHLGGLPHTGDGLLMAMEAGVATEDLGFLLRGGLPGAGFAAPRVLDEPYIIRLNSKGRRFVDEVICGLQHAYTGNEGLKTNYMVFDHKMVQYISEHGTIYLVGKERKHRYVPEPDLENAFKAFAEKGGMRIAGSWDDIAAYIGCDPAVLKDEIETYNGCCDRGYDPVFAKDRRFLWPLRTPPYYAVRGEIKPYLDTIGGIKINERMEALDGEDEPVPGLYAAGVCAGGWQAVDYNGLDMSGAAVGFAVNSGRIAGENAVAYIAGK